jgi:hypothetical protein
MPDDLATILARITADRAKALMVELARTEPAPSWCRAPVRAFIDTAVGRVAGQDHRHHPRPDGQSRRDLRARHQWPFDVRDQP